MTNLPDPSAPSNLRGNLLLAGPTLRDSTFRKSVILMAQHSIEEGAMGLILNKPTGMTVGDYLKDPSFAELAEIPVHDGGPVSKNQLTFSAFWWSREKGLCWDLRISADEAIDHARRPGRVVRAFVGYSGWESGQLESELAGDIWIVAQPKPNLLGLDQDVSLWSQLLCSLSPFHKLLAEAPDNPGLN